MLPQSQASQLLLRERTTRRLLVLTQLLHLVHMARTTHLRQAARQWMRRHLATSLHTHQEIVATGMGRHLLLHRRQGLMSQLHRRQAERIPGTIEVIAV
jgi:hypothetical protein